MVQTFSNSDPRCLGNLKQVTNFHLFPFSLVVNKQKSETTLAVIVLFHESTWICFLGDFFTFDHVFSHHQEYILLFPSIEQASTKSSFITFGSKKFPPSFIEIPMVQFTTKNGDFNNLFGMILAAPFSCIAFGRDGLVRRKWLVEPFQCRNHMPATQAHRGIWKCWK